MAAPRLLDDDPDPGVRPKRTAIVALHTVWDAIARFARRNATVPSLVPGWKISGTRDRAVRPGADASGGAGGSGR